MNGKRVVPSHSVYAGLDARNHRRRDSGAVEYGDESEVDFVPQRRPNPNSLSYWLFRKGGMVVVIMLSLMAVGLLGAIFGHR
jgi:hypothetical protein